MDERVYMMNNRPIYPYKIDWKNLHDYSTPRSVTFHDIYNLTRRNGYFVNSAQNLKTLDTRLTKKKSIATEEAIEIFGASGKKKKKQTQEKSSDHEQTEENSEPKGRAIGRPRKTQNSNLRGKVAKHKAIKYARPDLQSNIEQYVEKEKEIAGKVAVEMNTPSAF